MLLVEPGVLVSPEAYLLLFGIGVKNFVDNAVSNNKQLALLLISRPYK